MVRERRLGEKPNSAPGDQFVRKFAVLAATADKPARLALSLVQKIGQGHDVNRIENGLRAKRPYACEALVGRLATNP